MKRTRCLTAEPDYQAFPWKGILGDNLNWSLNRLIQELPSEQEISYCYIIATVENKNGYLVQTGSAPNFQGDVITLCTCKHYMRTFKSSAEWKGKWIAGFTGVKAGGGRNALVYLMKVAHAFESHQDLWLSTVLPLKTKQAKSASRSKLGDIYQPCDPSGDPFAPQNYLLPHSGHVHRGDNQWHKDINYPGGSRNRAALLVGDPTFSFVWERPQIFAQFRLHRGQKKFTLGNLLQQLQELRSL